MTASPDARTRRLVYYDFVAQRVALRLEFGWCLTRRFGAAWYEVAKPTGALGGHDWAVASVVTLHLSERHSFSKQDVGEVELIAGVGVAGDAHAGPLVQHRSRVAADPTQPNLRQVHLIATELFEVLAAAGHQVAPGDLGENVTTEGVEVHDLSVGTVIRLGETALIAVTGLRNPCAQIEAFQPGLLKQVSYRDGTGMWVPRAGIMGVVVLGGVVRVGDRIEVQPPPGPARPLERV
jgi:MOSC domain-containing protein YiiM